MNKWRNLIETLSPIIVSSNYDSSTNKIYYSVQKEIDCDIVVEQGADLTACLRRIEKKCKEKGYVKSLITCPNRYI